MKKKMLAICMTALMAIGIFSGCSSKQSGNSWDKVSAKKEFVLGLDASFPPMGFKDDNGNIVGFDIDLAKEVCKRLNITLKTQPINWDLKEQELNTGNIDAIWNGFTITDERKSQVLFSEPYMKNRQVIVVNKNSSIASLKDMAGKKLGLQAASSAADALDQSADFKKSLKDVVEYKDNVMALMDLEKGGVDAVLMDEIVARYYIQKKDKGYKVLDDALAQEEYGIGFRKNDKELMRKFQDTLEAMAKDGAMAKISKDWFGADITTIGK
ncbi:MAG: amino acid ABC transporter substrate-binding protein [Bacillota bacterium]|nr:amino acid ABC transporter substrate-binding protein [Bacillota bacterium]